MIRNMSVSGRNGIVVLSGIRSVIIVVIIMNLMIISRLSSLVEFVIV